MSIQARIKLLWGALGLIVSSLLLSWAYGTVAMNSQQPGPLAVSPNEPSYSATMRANIAAIANAIETYRWSHGDEFPPRLSMLYPTYISDPAVFWNPGDSDPCPTTITNDEPDQPNSTQISFVYLQRPGVEDTLVLQDNTLANNAGKGYYVMRFDSPTMTTFFEPMASPPAWTETARTNLKKLGVGLVTYANDNDGFYPDKLSRLFPHYISDPAVFWNPGEYDARGEFCPTTIDNDIPNRANSSQVSYTYLAANRSANCPNGTILLQDNFAANNGGAILNYLTADLVVTTCVQNVSCSSTMECRSLDRQNLSYLGSWLITYATANSDTYPTRLTMLYEDDRVVDPTTFWSRGDSDPRPLLIDNDESNRPGSTQISYAYFADTCNRRQLDVVLHDNTLTNNGGQGLHVMANDAAPEFFEPCSRSLPSSATARTNMQLIRQALQSYCAANAGRYPAKLSLLYPTYISNPAVFWNPGDDDPCPTTIDRDEPNRGSSAQVSYNYLGATYSAGCDPGVVLLADNSLSNNGGIGINLLTAGGQIGYYAPAPPSCQYVSVCTGLARSRLYEIGRALFQYVSYYDDHLPSNLSMLYTNGSIPRPTTFWHPGDSDQWPITISNDLMNQADSAQISFEYPAAGRKLWQMGSREILVRDNTPENNNGNGRVVLYASGSVEYVPIRSAVSIAVLGPDVVPEGGAATFACIVTYDDGSTRDVTNGSGWITADAGGHFNSPGQYVVSEPVLGDTPHKFRVLYADEAGHFFEIEKTITVQNTVRVLTGLTVSSGPATVVEGGTGNYKCTATYDDGGTEDVTALASWSVAGGPGAFPSAGTYAAPGTVLADTPVTIKVSYSREGVTKEATKNITVQNTVRVLASLAISSGPASVNEGASASYTCTATYDDSTTENVTASAEWSVSSGPGSFSAAGTYAAPGTVLANMPVTLLVTCTKGSVSKQATKNITVLNSVRKLSSLSISSGPASVAEGGNASYTCTATYDDSTTQNVTSGATWSVTSGPGSFSSPGAYAAPASVTNNTAVTIQASYVEAGISKQATKDIVVVNGIRRLSSIAIAGPASVSEGANASYTCMATYDDATTQDVTTSATWYLMGSPGSFLVPGTYAAPAPVLADTAVVIYVSYVEGGITQQANKSITVLNSVRKLASVEITSGPTEVAEAGSADYVCTATYDDDSLEDVTSQATWSVTSGVGVFSAKGKFAAPASVLADTPTTLSVSFGQGVTIEQASLEITVKNTIRRLASVVIASGPGAVTAGATGQYTCTAKYDDNTTQNATDVATWSVASGPGSFSAAGVYAAPASVVGAVTVTIKAKLVEAGVTKEVTKTIRVEPAPIVDADGDGVADGADACPGTSAGVVVDASGCAASQRDSDGDGVSDDRDQCPGTPSGTAVQANGCASSSVSDRDGDGVADTLDGCPDDPAKTSPGACGCGVPETPGCGTAPTYTVRVIAAEGAASPYTYPAGTWAEIAAPAAPEGMRFSHWSGAYNGTDAIARVYVDGDKQLVANYEECPEQGPAPCGAGAPAACGVVGVVLAMALVTRMRDKR